MVQVIVILVLLVFGLLLLGGLVWAGGGKTIHETRGSGIIEAIPDAWEQAPGPAETIGVLSYNLAYGLAGRHQGAAALDIAAICDALDQVAEAIAAAGVDVALLQEVDFASRRTYDMDQLHYLAAALGWGFAARALTWECRYLPYPLGSRRQPAGRLRAGMGVISRYPLVQNMRQWLSPAGGLPVLAAFFAPHPTGQMVEIQCGNQTLRVLHVHLAAGAAAGHQQQAQELVDFVQRVETPSSVLMGVLPAADLILSRLGSRFRAVSETATWPGGQRVLIGSGLRVLDVQSLTLDGVPRESQPLMVRLHWSLPVVGSHGRGTPEPG